MTAPVPDSLFLELQSVLAGRYSLERELGRGGMGIVYLARDVALDRLVAIKLFPPDLAAQPALRERFLREARTAARLSHPNIVPIHAVEESGRLVWFVMAYVPGESLAQRLGRGALTPADAARILRDVAWALGYAHSQGIVHRDVKPDNILLETGGRRALVADFGIAAPARGDLGAEGTVVGTVAYLSPEQARGDAVDGRSDVYAVGVVGYRALADRLPYPASSLSELIQRQLAGPAPPLAGAAPHVPRALCRLIDRCLAGYPSARFQTGEELAEALQQLGSAPTDLPAPLRVWISQANQRRGPAVFLSVAWGLPILIGAVAALFSQSTVYAFLGLSLAGLAILVLPWGGYALVRMLHTRRVLRAGYTHADLIHALNQHIERRREELAFEHGTRPTRLGTVFNGLILLGAAGTVGGVVVAAIGGAAVSSAAAGLALGIGLATAGLFLARNLVPGARSGARDRLAEFAHRFWKGPIGRWMVRASGWRLRPAGAPDEVLHRPTEVALGEASDALFRALPSAQRKELKHLPEQIRFLSTEAQAMRQKLEELDDLIAQAAPDTLFGEERPAGDGGAAALQEARDLWAARLRQTVTLLESLRVGLLKLHAGSAVPDTLTADLEAARELRERLGLLAEGQAEVADLLPRPNRSS
jgi:serine/threonine-protein kinase